MNTRAARRRVLVVEDNPDQARTMSALLDLMGHEVRCADSGHTAIETARALRPHVVLLDLGLPGMDGFEVARRLRASPGLAGVRLVALSGYNRPRDRAAAEEAGIDSYHVKPVSVDEILGLLSTLTGRERQGQDERLNRDD